MIILHNPHDKESRDWVAIHATTEDTVLDWYDENDRQAWLDNGGNLEISAFPSVAVETPEWTDPD
ncbi:MAG: hypothetical protein ACPG5T_07615, partial [Endozoicomonas sp.]